MLNLSEIRLDSYSMHISLGVSRLRSCLHLVKFQDAGACFLYVCFVLCSDPAVRDEEEPEEPKLTCELCGWVDFAYKFKGSKRFCSVVCAKRYSNWMLKFNITSHNYGSRDFLSYLVTIVCVALNQIQRRVHKTHWPLPPRPFQNCQSVETKVTQSKLQKHRGKKAG